MSLTNKAIFQLTKRLTHNEKVNLIKNILNSFTYAQNNRVLKELNNKFYKVKVAVYNCSNTFLVDSYKDLLKKIREIFFLCMDKDFFDELYDKIKIFDCMGKEITLADFMDTEKID